MRRDRRWARWPLAVLLGTALALAPFLGAAAYAMEDDAAGGSPSVTVETVDDVTMPVVEAEPASRTGSDAPPDPGAAFVPDGIAASAEELALELDVGGEVMLSADIEATSQLVTTTVVTLDLNGYVLTASIVVRDGMLVVRDSSESQAGALVGPDGAFPIVAEAWGQLGDSGVCGNGEPVWRQDARCNRHSGRNAPEGGVHGGVQDQY